MKVKIHSIQSLKQQAHKPFSAGTILISIDDPRTEFPKLEHKPDHILRLEFDDITISDIYESGVQYFFRLFSTEQANQIADFVYSHLEDCETLICQCRFGQSRSAAVAAAIKEHFYHNGIEIFANGQKQYSPNLYVFRLTLLALQTWKTESGSVKSENGD